MLATKVLSDERSKKRRRRSIFDAVVVIGANREMDGSGEGPALWYHGIEDGKGFLG